MFLLWYISIYISYFFFELGLLVVCRIVYGKVLVPGPHCIRPWQLAFRSDYGLSNVMEPDQLVELVELILRSGPLACYYLWRAKPLSQGFERTATCLG